MKNIIRLISAVTVLALMPMIGIPATAEENETAPAPAVSHEETVKHEEAPKTEAPVEKTEVSVEKTEVTVEKTEATVEKMEAPIEKTEGTVEKTEAPVENTETPVEKTEAPAEPEIAEKAETPVNETDEFTGTEPEPEIVTAPEIEAATPEEDEGDVEEKREAVREKIREAVTEEMEPVIVEGEPETIVVEGPETVTEETVSEEDMWFDEGEAKLKELEKEGWVRLRNKNGVMKTEGDKTIYVINTPTGFRRIVSDDTVTSTVFKDRDEAYAWILEHGLVDFEVETLFRTSEDGLIYHEFSDYEEADRARIEAMNRYYIENGNRETSENGFIRGVTGGVSDRVYENNMTGWSELNYRALIGELRSTNFDPYIKDTIGARLAKLYGTDNIDFTFERKTDLRGTPAEITVTLKEPCVIIDKNAETGEEIVRNTTHDVVFTFKTLLIDGTDDVTILPTSGKIRFNTAEPEKEPCIAPPVLPKTPDEIAKERASEVKSTFRKIGDKVIGWFNKLIERKETPPVVIEEPVYVDPGVKYGYYEIRHIPVYRASGHRVNSGNRSTLSVTEETTVRPLIEKTVTPLEELKMSYALTWETDDGSYTCHGIRLDDGRRATEYYSNETGELVAVVPMK